MNYLNNYVDFIKRSNPIIEKLVNKGQAHQAYAEYRALFPNDDPGPFDWFQQADHAKWQAECQPWLERLTNSIVEVKPAMVYIECDPLNEWQIGALHLDQILEPHEEDHVWDHFMADFGSTPQDELTELAVIAEHKAESKAWDSEACAIAEYGMTLNICCYLMHQLRHEFNRPERFSGCAHDAPFIVLR